MKCWILSGTYSTNPCVRYRFLNFRLLLTYHWRRWRMLSITPDRVSISFITQETLRSLGAQKISPWFSQLLFFAVNSVEDFLNVVFTARNQMVWWCPKQNVCQKSSLFLLKNLSCGYFMSSVPFSKSACDLGYISEIKKAENSWSRKKYENHGKWFYWLQSIVLLTSKPQSTQ